MKLSLLLVFFSLIFSEDSGWWGCQDPNALNYDPYSFWDCGDWCCEYEDEDNYYFINPKSFEQINIKKNIVGDKGKMLSENLEVIVSFYNENPLTLQLPNQVTCTIETTDVALKGQTVSSSYKPATLDNGIKIQVPPFIESGDKIIVDTRTIEYVKKV